jgi:hypothetical protein
MGSILPACGFGMQQMQVRLMHKRCGLECMSRPLIPHMPTGDTAEFAVDQRRQPV